MREVNIKDVLEKHKKWLNNEEGGVRADLRSVDLHGADLTGVDLQNADLRGADLQGADLTGVDLQDTK